MKNRILYSTVMFITIIILLMVVVMSFTGCNRAIGDFTYNFDRAIISLPNGDVIDGKVQSWLDFEDGDQIQVKIDGKTYLIHSENVVLISE